MFSNDRRVLSQCNTGEILAVYEAAVPTNTEKTSKPAWQCLQIQFWLKLFLEVRLKVDDENRHENLLFCLQYATYNNLHKATHVLLFRDERN